MKFLYVDNYRGFRNTFIPIMDVNFLVGENSTGKSSILSVINLIGDPTFWFSQEFNTKRVELGAFRDIISKNSTEQYFRIGVIEYDEAEESQNNEYSIFLATFGEFKGIPKIKDYNFVKNKKQIRIVFSRKTIRFKIAEIDNFDSDIAKALQNVFNEWLEMPAGTGRGYKFFPLKERAAESHSFIVVKTIIQQIAIGEKKGSVEVGDLVDLQLPEFAQQLAWLAPVRTKPERVYGGLNVSFSPEGEHTPRLIKDLLNQEKVASRFEKFTRAFGVESDLFEGLYAKSFGRSQSAPFELGVKMGENRYRISDVGYGVSQVLPIIVELFARSSGSVFALQQPEIHLHPKAQAALGNLIFELAISENKKFFVETHSDYTIDRFRICYRDNENAKSISSQVLFFERKETRNIVHSISIDDKGNYSDKQPKNFRDFFIKEEMRVLGL